MNQIKCPHFICPNINILCNGFVRPQRYFSHQFLIRGISMARLVRPDRRLKGLGAHSKAMPLAVLSVYSGVSFRKGSTNSGSSNSSSSSGRGSWLWAGVRHWNNYRGNYKMSLQSTQELKIWKRNLICVTLTWTQAEMYTLNIIWTVKSLLQLQPGKCSSVTIHLNFPPVLTHRQANHCKRAFVRGFVSKLHV